MERQRVGGEAPGGYGWSTLLTTAVPLGRLALLFRYIRTFAVVPLSEDCGLIEWVPNTTGLRYILIDLYKKQKGAALQPLGNNSIVKLYDSIKPRGALTELECYQQILPHFPPVMHKWFVLRFPNPTRWFEARLRCGYRHSTAPIIATTAAECPEMGIGFPCDIARSTAASHTSARPRVLLHSLHCTYVRVSDVHHEGHI